ncbi:MAG: alpha/beta fold hydrolase [Myxococcota bacterium]
MPRPVPSTATVVVVHSAGPQGPGEGSEPLVRRLRDALGDAFDVRSPPMPGEDEPTYGAWRDRLAAELDQLDGPAQRPTGPGGAPRKVIVVGHSLGGSVALKVGAEGGLGDRVAALITVAAPFWGTDGWQREWALPEGWPSRGPSLPPTTLVHACDDVEIPASALDRYAERIPGVAIRRVDDGGHLFADGDLSAIVDAIRSS